MSEPLSLVVDSIADVPVLRLRGELVYGQDLQPIHDAVVRLKEEGHGRLVVDLTDVGATDSSGISTLLEIRKIFGTNMILLRPSARLRASLGIARVTSMFAIIEDEAELDRNR
jgi:anti-anti-sigma factor